MEISDEKDENGNHCNAKTFPEEKKIAEFGRNWSKHVKIESTNLNKFLKRKWYHIQPGWSYCWDKRKHMKFTITNIPSRRVGSSSSFFNVSSPLVTFPKIAYYEYQNIFISFLFHLSELNRIISLILIIASAYFAIKVRSISK